MSRFLTLPEFAAQAKAGGVRDAALQSLGLAEAGSSGDESRVISYKLSDSSVARDGHRINTAGWVLDNYNRNPVFLWAHDANDPPIGRMLGTSIRGDSFYGDVEYADADLYPFADTIFRMVKRGFLNAVSVAWNPLEWKFATEKGRAGCIDFISQELLEVSQVPVPAMPTALVQARAAGIDTQPVFDWASKLLDLGGIATMPKTELETLRRAAQMPKHIRAAETPDWKMGAASDLPVSPKVEWDGPAAAERMLDAAGFNGDSPDSAEARKGFLAYDAANPALKGSYKLPIADVIDGKLTVTKGGVDAASSRLPDTDIPDDVKTSAGKVLDGYKDKLKTTAGAKPKQRGFKRDLGTVSWLAYLLEMLAWMQQDSAAEEAWEGDDSTIPAQLAEALKTLGGILVAMTAEEVGELIAGTGVTLDDDDDAVFMAGAQTPQQRALRGLAMIGRRAFGNARTVTVTGAALDPAKFETLLRRFERAGKVLSAENEKTLRSAHGMMSSACDLVRGVVEQATTDEPDNGGDINPDGEDDVSSERAARALRARQAKARAAAIRAAALQEPTSTA